MGYHVLAKNCKCNTPTHFVFFDTETRIKQLKNGNILYPLRLGCAISVRRHFNKQTDSRHVMFFRRPQQLYQYITQKAHNKTRVCVFAHNIGFDLCTSHFYYQAFRDGWRSRIPYAKGRVFIDSLKLGNKRIDLIDSMNYFPFPLKNLGASFNLPKLSVDFHNVCDKDLRIYCQRDVEIIEKAVLWWMNFVKDNDLGNMQKTLPGQAFSAYRHRFMPEKIKIDCKGQPKELERDGYYGGRVECFKIGKIAGKKFFKLDVNSMYPYVMAKEKYPISFSFKEKGHSPIVVADKLKRYLAVANCFLDTNEPAYPKRINERLCFPIGRFWTVLTTPEILYAITKGHLIKADTISYYKQANIFKEYVNYFYSERLKSKKKGNIPEEKMFKLMLNSLYGKFGQKQRECKEQDIDNRMIVSQELIYDMDNKQKVTRVKFGGRQKDVYITDKDSYNSFCAIAAHVTAYARIYLYELIRFAGFNNCFYCDTDSLFVNRTGLRNIKLYLNDSELGGLKIEDQTDNLIVNTAKDYVFGDEIKKKGIPSRAEKLAYDKFTYQEWPSFRSVFKRGLRKCYMTHKITKKLSYDYTKGELLDIGKVKPFCLNESEKI